MATDTFRSFTLRPHTVTDRNGEVLDLSRELHLVKRMIISSQALGQWEIDENGQEMIDKLMANPDLETVQVNTAAGRMGLRIPYNLTGDILEGRSGRSRLGEAIYGEVVAHIKSWKARIEATHGTNKTFVSSGFKRTARDTKPNIPFKLNLGLTSGGQFARWDKEIPGALHMVVNGYWRVFHFAIPDRFSGRISLPTVKLDKETGEVIFHLSERVPYQQGPISNRYTVGVDVGKVNYATVVVWDQKEGRIAYSTTLSQKVHGLWNSAQASERQKKRLRELGRFDEERLHREAESRKKAELAIMAAQEIAEIAYIWDNSIVVFEDLSWIRNTMQNGRWNRGELVKWTTHFVEQNGSRVMKVNAANTSQKCHKCSKQVIFSGRTAICRSCHYEIDRDVNAGANIAMRAVKSVVKMIGTRKKSKSYTNTPSKRRSRGGSKPLKYPGRDRTKNGPTPKRPKKIKKSEPPVQSEEVNSDKRPLIRPKDDYRVVRDGETRKAPGLVISASSVPARLKRE